MFDVNSKPFGIWSNAEHRWLPTDENPYRFATQREASIAAASCDESLMAQSDAFDDGSIWAENFGQYCELGGEG